MCVYACVSVKVFCPFFFLVSMSLKKKRKFLLITFLQ